MPKGIFQRLYRSGSRRQLLAFGVAALAAAAATPAAAQNYPNRPITIICAFPPGNAADIVARVIGEQLSVRLGQPVVIDNRAGASGTIAAMAVARAPADGYTLLMTSTSFAINTAVLANVPYDLQKDFTPINFVNSIPAVLIVNKSFPADNIQQFVAEVKSHPGKYSYGQVGSGTIQNMSMKLFQMKTGSNILEVPYKGSVQAITDIIAGNLDMMFESANSSATFVKSGKVKAIAASGPTRYFALPDIPTASEAGIDFSVVGWTMLAAPPGMPAAISERLNREVREILASPAIGEKMMTIGFEVFPPLDVVDTAKRLQEESARWISVAAASQMKKE